MNLKSLQRFCNAQPNTLATTMQKQVYVLKLWSETDGQIRVELRQGRQTQPWYFPSISALAEHLEHLPTKRPEKQRPETRASKTTPKSRRAT